MPISVRGATTSDRDTICLFNSLLAEESEGKRLDPDTLRPGVSALLADPHKGYYFIAESAGDVLGQLGVTFEWSDWRNGWFWWIQSVYVRAEHRGRGIFRALYQHVRSRATAAGNVIGIRLYVELENTAAQATYSRMGMSFLPYKVLEESLAPGYQLPK